VVAILLDNETSMIKPAELATDLPHGPWSCRGCDIWDTIQAAATGDTDVLRRLLERDPNLYRAAYWYAQPIHFAVREGHLEAVQILLDAGADPTATGLFGEDLITVARDRDHQQVATLLEDAAAKGDRIPRTDTPADHPIHIAADAGDAEQVRTLLDADPQLIHRCDHQGGTPLHRAVAASARDVIELLLDRGADIHATHGSGPGSERGYAAADFQPIDLAFWTGSFWGMRGDLDTARLLKERGAAYDLVIAAASGDLAHVQRLLDADPTQISHTRPSGKHALAAAVEFGHPLIARMLLDRGADPNSPDGATAPRGAALYAAARSGDRPLIELLLAHGADPNGWIDSGGSATYIARTRELRDLLMANGGTLDTYDLVWLGEDDEVVRRVSADPSSANAGCGGVFTAACKLGKRDLVVRLLQAGARVPAVATGCRSYLMSDPQLLRLLLASGMNPDMPDWQLATPLHDLCGRDSRGRPQPHRTDCATILLDAGANISAKDEDYRSTPLAWAARTDLPDMVELLLARGAPTNLPDDQPWATPLAWALKRGHHQIALTLRGAGAVA
jgi:ankyrin repeat protein